MSISDSDQQTALGRRLFLLGFLTLFLELVLIRWLAGNVWNLGYFPNFVLLAVFTGMALGFVFHSLASERASPWLFRGALALLTVLSALVTFARPAVPGFDRSQGSVAGELYFTASDAETGPIMFLVPFLLIVMIFAGISQRTAKAFAALPPLRAYTLDIAGSIAGILSFMVLSFLHAPAFSWFICLLPLCVFADPSPSKSLQMLPAIPLLLCVSFGLMQDSALVADPQYSGMLEVDWSPYQKIEFTQDPSSGQAIYANGIVHQGMLDPETLRHWFYAIPHDQRVARHMPAYHNVLVIGAGSGNDVAAALDHGAQHVDAVEIDPVIADIGRRFHLAAPYKDPRVSLHIDDGRAFMTSTTRRYDLIIFALTDSLVKVSSMSQLRLENYIFTVESVRKAWRLLAKNGDFMMYNYYREPWLLEKFGRMLQEATEREPQVLFERSDFRMTMVGNYAAFKPAVLSPSRVEVPTDDWPFPYLRQRGMPPLYSAALAWVSVFAALLLGGLGRFSRRGGARQGSLALMLAFMLMGTAFLLLETKSIVQFSLLFGTTWLNTSLVFLGVLVSVLVANWLAHWLRGERHVWITAALLVVACLVGYLYPLANLLAVQSTLLRFLAASALTVSPILLANLLFSIALRDQRAAERLFGWNLFGATLGGLVEYTSLAIGYRALALIVAGCYACVVLLLLYASRSAARQPELQFGSTLAQRDASRP